MNQREYPKYKPSGVEWLGEIPEHWNVLHLKRILSAIESGKRTNEDVEETEDVFSVGGEHINWNGALDLSNPRYISNDTYSSMYRGRIRGRDVLMVKDGATIGKTAFVPILPYDRMAVNEHVFILRPTIDVLPEFLYFLIASGMAQQQIALLTKGAAQPGLSSDFAGDVWVAIPPLVEQRTVVMFLRNETQILDKLIEKKKQQIELVYEKRDAEIARAISKGVNLDSPLATSDIEWLDKVPCHWEARRARFLFRQLFLPPNDDSGIVTAFRDGQVTLRGNRRTEGYTFAIKELGYQGVRVGDLVIHSMDAFAGAIGVSESNGKCTGEYVVCESLNAGLNNEYYAECLRFMAKQRYIYVICSAVRERAPRFRFNRFKDVMLPVPPREEQASIAEQIIARRTRATQLIERINLSLHTIAQYRLRLITAAVTGKIDVRNSLYHD